MTITIKSKIEKGSIRLPKKVGLPDGTKVVVSIEPILKAKEKLAWADDPTIISIFKAIEQERHTYYGREVSLG